MTYDIKDSGERASFDSGMVRDVTEGKTDYSLAFDGPMFERWAQHLTKGAEKYDKRNWMLAAGDAEYDRFRESALRHFIQWYRGDEDEDHAAAVFFNINGTEYVIDQSIADDCPGCEDWDDGDLVDVPSPDEKMAQVGDITTDDLITAILESPGGLQDLADDYNYLRNRVNGLSVDL